VKKRCTHRECEESADSWSSIATRADLIARFEFGDSRSNPLHHTRHIKSQLRRQLHRQQRLHLTSHQHSIDGIEGGAEYAYEDVVG